MKGVIDSPWSGPLRVLICGQRDYARYEAVLALVRTLAPGSVVIHGAARGADTFADRAAKAEGLEVLAFPADWLRFHQAAGPIRNRQMLDEGKPDMIWAFYRKGGQAESKGTNDMVAQARRRGVPVLILEDEDAKT